MGFDLISFVPPETSFTTELFLSILPFAFDVHLMNTNLFRQFQRALMIRTATLTPLIDNMALGETRRGQRHRRRDGSEST